jgi:hypothetical protein
MSYDSKLIDVLRNSKHAIPIIQSFHLFGITLLLASMVILNFRMLGIGLRKSVWRFLRNRCGAGEQLVLAMTSGLIVLFRTPRYAASYSF